MNTSRSKRNAPARGAVACSVLRVPSPRISRNTQHATRNTPAFTLIEILVVCAIMGIVMTISIPMLRHQLFTESMQKVTSDIMEACSHGRAYAILQGVPVDLVIRAEDGNISLQAAAGRSEPGSGSSGAGHMRSPDVAGNEWRSEERPAGGGTGEQLSFSSKLPEKIAVELIEVNFQDAMEYAEVRVRFYPNGTSDEFKMLLFKPETNERRLITLEVVTGMADVESDVLKMR